MREKYDPDELDYLKSGHNLVSLFNSLGIRTKGGKVAECSCPHHMERTPSCKINAVRGRYKCFGCGASGDHIDILMHMRGIGFREAVEALGGVKAITSSQKSELQQRRSEIEAEDEKDHIENRKRVERLLKSCKPILGTGGEEYLVSRYLDPNPDWTFDLMFAPSIMYRGFADDDADAQTHLGDFPAMVAIIRNHGGEIIGAHRTYLDPKTFGKLKPPASNRNRVKKILGEQVGGLIWLSKSCEQIAVGEGIETTRSWIECGFKDDGVGYDSSEMGAAAAVSLGNLSGPCTGSNPHPSIKGRVVPNGIPDLSRPGIVWPKAAKLVVFLQDSDSEPLMTRRRIVCAIKRAESQGKKTAVSRAPDGLDWSDYRTSLMKSEAL